jgi:serine/threonine protein kinase
MADRVLLGRYRVVGQIDEGGMSRILLARSLDRGQEVAIKVLHEAIRKDDKVRKHFQREIHVLSQINHPHVVEFIDSSVDDPQGPVLVMEYLRGACLNTMLAQEERLTPLRVGKLLEQLCSALAHIHSLGIVHRDLKPGNIMIVHPGTPHEAVKLLDFGLAALHTSLYLAPEDIAGSDRTAISGTPHYICPEQAQGLEMDGRGDVYSLGVLLYEMLSGHLPFRQELAKELLLAHQSLTPATFSQLGAGQGVPPSVEAVVRGCLAKSPAGRPQSAGMLNDRFQAALGHSRAASSSTPQLPDVHRLQPLASRTQPRHEMEDPSAQTFKLNVTMPEAMALVKIKGFIHDLNGEIVESIPGMIRVLIPQKAKAASSTGSGILGWLHADRPAQPDPADALEMKLLMEKNPQDRAGGMTIKLVLRQRGMQNRSKARSQARSEKLFRDLQAYLIASS